MNNECKAIFKLINSALTGEKVSLCADLNWNKIFQIARLHQIVPLIFYGLKNSNIETPYDENFFEVTSQHILLEQQQFNAIQIIKNTFTQNGIDFALLKGSRAKAIYPKTEMRIMGDIDILIKPEQYSKIRPLMLQMGFDEGSQWDYEYHYKKGSVNIELHKQLVSKSLKDLYSYYGDGWQKFKPQNNEHHSFEMSVEDEYIYIFTHLTRHYRTGGIGLRQFIDIFAYGLKYPKMNMDYVNENLAKLGLVEFHSNVLQTLKCWFCGMQVNDTVKAITIRAFASGLFGTPESNDMVAISKAVKGAGNAKKAVIKELFFVIFPTLGQMKKRYKVLSKAPVLLPVMWVVRWFGLFSKPQKLKIHIKRFKKFNHETVNEFNKQFEKVGL